MKRSVHFVVRVNQPVFMQTKEQAIKIISEHLKGIKTLLWHGGASFLTRLSIKKSIYSIFIYKTLIQNI